mgnify:CR=1 FL=1
MTRCTTHKAACGIETKNSLYQHIIFFRCTTHKAACGIETIDQATDTTRVLSCTTHKAACGIETMLWALVKRVWLRLHHPQSRVRH